MATKIGVINESPGTILQKFLVILLAKKCSDLRKPEAFITIFIKTTTYIYVVESSAACTFVCLFFQIEFNMH